MNDSLTDRRAAARDLRAVLIAIRHSDPSHIGEEHFPDVDAAYAFRNRMVWRAVGLAAQIGFPTGVAPDPQQPGWLVAYVELPTGQVSWHLPAYPMPWDGHTTDEKYARTDRWIFDDQRTEAEILYGLSLVADHGKNVKAGYTFPGVRQ